MQQPNHKYKTSDQKRSKPKGTLAEFKINDSCRNHLAGSDGRQTSWFSSSISWSCTLSRASERQLFTGLSYILIPYRDNELKHQLLCICLLVDRKGLCLFGKWFLQLHASFFINVNMAMLLISFGWVEEDTGHIKWWSKLYLRMILVIFEGGVALEMMELSVF